MGQTKGVGPGELLYILECELCVASLDFYASIIETMMQNMYIHGILETLAILFPKKRKYVSRMYAHMQIHTHTHTHVHTHI